MSALEESNPDRKTRWKTVTEQQIYSMKLIKALRRRSTRTDPNLTVRETADRILASASGGRTRWSRAILGRRHRKVRVIRMKKMTKIPDLFQRKTRVLGELVPGCRKISFCRLVEESMDYIPALEMQVRAMTAILAKTNNQP